jgi:hypothetical protein
MADDRKKQGLSDKELERRQLEKQQITELPDREAMSLVHANVAAPVNVAIAANILADEATTTAEAIQDIEIDQSN